MLIYKLFVIDFFYVGHFWIISFIFQCFLFIAATLSWEAMVSLSFQVSFIEFYIFFNL